MYFINKGKVDIIKGLNILSKDYIKRHTIKSQQQIRYNELHGIKETNEEDPDFKKDLMKGLSY